MELHIERLNHTMDRVNKTLDLLTDRMVKEIQTRTVKRDLPKDYPVYRRCLNYQKPLRERIARYTDLYNTAIVVAYSKPWQKIGINGDPYNLANFDQQYNKIERQLTKYEISIGDFEKILNFHFKNAVWDYVNLTGEILNKTEQEGFRVLREKQESLNRLENHLGDIVPLSKLKEIDHLRTDLNEFKRRFETEKDLIGSGHFTGQTPIQNSVGVELSVLKQGIPELERQILILDKLTEKISKIEDKEQKLYSKGLWGFSREQICNHQLTTINNQLNKYLHQEREARSNSTRGKITTVDFSGKSIDR